MKYTDAVTNLKLAFHQLAIAKQNYNLLGGSISFYIAEDQLTMVTSEGRSSFPFTISPKDKEKFQRNNPHHEFKSGYQPIRTQHNSNPTPPGDE